MIASCKNREEDRMAELDAGANYRLTKSSFCDQDLIAALKGLIGHP